MSITILEVLYNAEDNLESPLLFKRTAGLQQLKNAIKALEEDSDSESEYKGGLNE